MRETRSLLSAADQTRFWAGDHLGQEKLGDLLQLWSAQPEASPDRGNASGG
jgi:hypothetical protein